MTLEALKKKIKQANNECFTHIKHLESQVDYMREGFAKLFQEEDIQNLPSYKLLKLSYGEYMTGSVPVTREVADSGGQNEIYDPIYAPPKVRSKVVAASRKAVAQQAAESVAAMEARSKIQAQVRQSGAQQSQQASTNIMPDFSVDLLTPSNPAKKKPRVASTNATEAAAAATKVVKITPTATVYIVEIQGVSYLKHGVHLYDRKTKERVGNITDTCFNIGGNPVEIKKSVKMSRVADADGEYYKDGNSIYVPVNDGVAHCVGEFNDDGDMCLWA